MTSEPRDGLREADCPICRLVRLSGLTIELEAKAARLASARLCDSHDYMRSLERAFDAAALAAHQDNEEGGRP